jgi:hypothetical protein
MKNKYWIAIFAVLFVLCLALVFLPKNSTPAQTAQVVSDGKVIRILNLNMPQEFTVEVTGGYNTVTVRDGKIAVTQADCPDGYCMQRGWCEGGPQIVCLPNRLVIRFTGEAEVDAIS